MMLTGMEISSRREAGEISISPFSSEFLEPNSYCVHLGNTLIEYDEPIIDARQVADSKQYRIPKEGLVLEPARFYLGYTVEKIGGINFASELFANHSTAALGIWIQTSAPLGHVGAVIRWTLEICVAQRVRVFPGMKIGKVCFWKNFGQIQPYKGRYLNSNTVISSKSFMDNL